MVGSKSLFSRFLILLVVLIVGVVLGVYWPSSEVEITEEGQEVSDWRSSAESLALGGARFIFLPLNNPGVVKVDAADHMKQDDFIAGVVVNGHPRAYPLWLLVAYHVVNDTIHDSPVMLAYCEICSGASAFSPVIDTFENKSLTFQIHGIARGTFSVYDYQTQTVWSPFSGRTIEGKLHPSRLGRTPLIVEPWSDWVKRYPETEVAYANRVFMEQREHGRGEQNTIGHEFLPDVFQQVANMSDTRLIRNKLVFGIADSESDKSIAFPLDLLDSKKEPVKYEFENDTYLLKKIGQFGVAAFRLQGGQIDKSYSVIREIPFRIGDEQGGVWDEFGNAVEGAASQSKLEAADGYFTEWYEWVSNFPGSEIATSL
ncbi:MAG: DUF3179 domain-containing (seleno)protein [Acidobacteriota bacterium]